jgi:competence protein ComEC
MGRMFRVLALFALASCESEDGTDAGSDAGRARDAGPAIDSGRDAGRCVVPAAPSEVLRPRAGELFYAQIGLGGLGLGESALLVGPDGTRVLIDVANDSHDDDIDRVLGEILGDTSIDHIVITHFHADHGDGIGALLDRIELTGSIVHRGFTDLTGAANDATIEAICEAIEAHPGSAAPLCRADPPAPCDSGSWTGTYPAIACEGLTNEDLSLGSASIDFLGANGFIDGERYEAIVGPFRADDSNGENARSVVALISHGAFRMLVAGDLTGGGSDTDDLESFYASRLDAIGARGVDVLHAGHHGRNTSTNAAWADRLLPNDGQNRNAIMGISTAHLDSPHDEVLAVLFAADRLRDGRAWTTKVSVGGASGDDLVDADGGHILIATLDGGNAYAIQAVAEDGTLIESRAFASVEACP